MTEFKAWPKIKRVKEFNVVVTEKVDGTNGCVIITNGEVVGVQSRKRIITPSDDNFGFANWVERNKEDLKTLGDGYHYGEWAGPGIQKNPHQLDTKQFFLFNSYRWKEEKPLCCEVVPILYSGGYKASVINQLIEAGSQIGPDEGFEGVMIYFPFADTYLKHTIKSPEGKWVSE